MKWATAFARYRGLARVFLRLTWGLRPRLYAFARFAGAVFGVGRHIRHRGSFEVRRSFTPNLLIFNNLPESAAVVSPLHYLTPERKHS